MEKLWDVGISDDAVACIRLGVDDNFNVIVELSDECEAWFKENIVGRYTLHATWFNDSMFLRDEFDLSQHGIGILFDDPQDAMLFMLKYR